MYYVEKENLQERKHLQERETPPEGTPSGGGGGKGGGGGGEADFRASSFCHTLTEMHSEAYTTRN